MRNPNGYGSVVKLSGNRRNPFCVRKTKGWNEKGHPIYDVIGYFPTREAGMIALAEYNRNQAWVDTVLILLYSGWRITELLTLKTENVDLKAGTMKGGIKTRNGKDRIVPIHPKIEQFIQEWANRGNEYLITDEHGHRLSDGQYRPHFKAIMEQLGFNHCPHECRHTLRSRLDSAGANKKCIDLILGHKSKDVGERVYTHKTIDELKHALELVSR